MSGGSMDYICFKIDDCAEKLEDKELIELAHDFAQVFHDAEWYHSGDIDKDDYKFTIKQFKDKYLRNGQTERLCALVEQIINDARKECMDLIGVSKKPEVCKYCEFFETKPKDDYNYGICKVWHNIVMKHDIACDRFKECHE